MKLYAVNVGHVADQEMLQLLWEKASAEKRKRLANYRNPIDVMRSLTAEALARRMCAAWIGCTEEAIAWEYNAHGKPLVRGVPSCCFNVSHSGEWVVCAIDALPIGVDVEQVDDMHPDLARRFFTEAECRYIMNGDRLTRFFEIWTLKESYIKAEGKGLSIPLRSFSIEMGEHQEQGGEPAIRVKLDGGYAGYALRLVRIAEGYKLAVCAAKLEPAVRLNQFTCEELVTARANGMAEQSRSIL